MNASILKELKLMKPYIPMQTYRTIIGQIRAGDLRGASIGIDRLKKKLEKEVSYHDNSCSK